MTTLAVGLCGCGNMGSAIAEQLRGRADLIVFDLDRARMEATGGAPVESLRELAAAATTVLLSLPSPEASATVARELASLLPTGSIVVETSTVSPSHMRGLQREFADRGVHLVDAAILSGPSQMRSGSTTLLIGGDDAAVAAATPVLELLGGQRIRLGELGSGMAAKLANNAVSHAVMVVLVEAAALAAAAGVSPQLLAEILTDPDGGLFRPLTHRLKERVFDGDFEGGMPTEAALKDSRLALELAQSLGVPLFAIQGAHTVYELAVAQDLGRADYAAIARLWEEWTSRSLRRDEPLE
jgi:3-hydroxyisobutyrate dehydrogenase-like beta-hydroxyacid dehydrogenase